MSDVGPWSSDRDVAARAADGDALGLARALVRIPSVNPALEDGGTGEGEAAESVRSWLQGWGFGARTESVAPGRWNVVAVHPPESTPAAGPALLLNGHLDTVGVNGMVVPPFEGAVREGRLIGRGACDMKGGVGALLSAAAALAREGHEGSLVIALTADEEHASLGMEALVAGGTLPDAAVVCEPTSLSVMPAHKGFVWMTALFRGRAAHGSRPDLGVDAIQHAGLFLSSLEGLRRRLGEAAPHPLLGRPSFHAGTIRGGSTPSVYPEHCEVVIERRTLPGEALARVEAEFAEVLSALRSEVPDVDAALETTLVRSGSEVAADATLVRGLLSAAAAEGVEPRIEGMSAWVDAALLNAAGTPAVCFGPGSIAQAHSADEWAAVEEIERCARILERFARDFLAGRTGG